MNTSDIKVPKEESKQCNDKSKRRSRNDAFPLLSCGSTNATITKRFCVVLLSIISFMVERSHALPSPSSSSSSSSLSASATRKMEETIEQLGLHGIRPDPFVAASPLIAAAVCSDGIAMVAAHTVSTKEKLLRDFQHDFRHEAADTNDDTNTNSNSNNNTHNVHSGGTEDKDNTALSASTDTFADCWKELQRDHGGPFRIRTIDRFATHLLTAGWRADCDVLTAKFRSISSKEIAVFGPPKWGLFYGRYLAQEASLWMAQCAVTDRMRPLSCVGLLVSCSDQNVKDGNVGSLWFIDITGAYRVRALAVGGGKVEGGGGGKEQEGNQMVAQVVNLYLQETDFSTMTAQEGVVRILEILRGQTCSKGVSNPMLVPTDCEMELAISSDGVVRRLALSTLVKRDKESA